MSNSILKKFAAELKKTREKNKLTIDQIFTKTRIDKKFLNAIEEGNFSILPEVYIRAFIKEYSKTIGLDPDEVLKKFELAQRNEDYSVAEVDEIVSEKKEKTQIEKAINSAVKEDLETEKPVLETSSNKTVYYALVGFILLLSIFLIYKTFLSEEKNGIVTEKPFEEIVASQKNNNSSTERKEKKESKIKSKSIITPKKRDVETSQVKKSDLKSINLSGNSNNTNLAYPVNLTIIGTDQSWMRIVTDDANTTEFIIQNNMKKVFGAKSKIYLHIGNSGGVKLQLNGKELNFRGSPGRVRKILITKNGIEYLRRTPQINNEG